MLRQCCSSKACIICGKFLVLVWYLQQYLGVGQSITWQCLHFASQACLALEDAPILSLHKHQGIWSHACPIVFTEGCHNCCHGCKGGLLCSLHVAMLYLLRDCHARTIASFTSRCLLVAYRQAPAIPCQVPQHPSYAATSAAQLLLIPQCRAIVCLFAGVVGGICIHSCHDHDQLSFICDLLSTCKAGNMSFHHVGQ